MDPLEETMKKYNIPITRKNYLDLAYPDGIPEEWTAELEMGLPEHLREPLQPDNWPFYYFCYAYQTENYLDLSTLNFS